MANLPGSIKNLNTLLGEQLTEGGGGGGGAEPLIINIAWDEGVDGDVCDKTWQEIHDAFASGRTCVSNYEYQYEGDTTTGTGLVIGVQSKIPGNPESNPEYTVSMVYDGNSTRTSMVISSPNDYPYF